MEGHYQRLSWVHDLEHEGFRFAAFDCLTYNDEGEVVYFAWITNLPVRNDTVCELANHVAWPDRNPRHWARQWYELPGPIVPD